MPAASPVAKRPVAAFPGASSSASVTVNVTGVNATVAVGTATGVGGVRVFASGVFATGVVNAVSASSGGQTQAVQGFLLGFGPVADFPIAGFLGAGAGSVAAPIGVFATGVIGTAKVDTVIYATGVNATGAIGTVTASGSIVISVSGVAGFGVVANVAVVVVDPTVAAQGFLLGFGPVADFPIAGFLGAGAGAVIGAVFGTPIFARLGSVTVLVSSGSGVEAFGVYATGRVGDVYVRTYLPVSWVGINTAQSPGWTAVIT